MFAKLWLDSGSYWLQLRTDWFASSKPGLLREVTPSCSKSDTAPEPIYAGQWQEVANSREGTCDYCIKVQGKAEPNQTSLSFIEFLYPSMYPGLKVHGLGFWIGPSTKHQKKHPFQMNLHHWKGVAPFFSFGGALHVFTCKNGRHRWGIDGATPNALQGSESMPLRCRNCRAAGKASQPFQRGKMSWTLENQGWDCCRLLYWNSVLLVNWYGFESSENVLSL